MDIRRRINSFRFAFRGLADVVRSQPNARIHLLAAIAAAATAIWLQVSAIEWVALVVCIAGVLALEAANTAIEHLTDLVSPDFHPLAGKAKDAAAAAVLVMALGAAIVGMVIFGPRVWALLF